MRKIGWILAFVLLLPALARAEVSIAVLGDSLTQGYGLAQPEGLVPQLQGWLRGRGMDATMINAGVSGDTTAGGAARIGWTLTPGIDGLIVALGANDMLRGLDPGAARANLETVLREARDADVPVLLVGFLAPLNFGAAYKRDFDRIYPDLAAAFGALYAPNFFRGLPANAADPAAIREYLQPDGLHPNATGVGLIVEGLGPHVVALIARIEG